MAGLILQEQRRNRATNPSFEVDTAGWSIIGASSIARSTTRASVGAASGLITYGAGTAVTQGARFTVTGLTVGAVYSLSADLWVPAASLTASPSLYVTGVGPVTPAVTASDQWVRVSGTWTATATSHTVTVSNNDTATAGQTTYVDAVQVELASTAGVYFDGAATDTGSSSTLGATVYDWTGTAHASQSIQSVVVRGLTLTATPEPDFNPPRVRLDVTDTGTPVIADLVITRLDADGRYRTVRTSDGGPLPISGGVATVYDYEVPFGTTVTYSTDEADGPTAVTVLDVNVPWLVHPGVPSRSVPITIASQDDVTQTVDQGTFRILEREDPIVVTGGARSASTSTLGLRTHTDSERRALKLLLSDAAPLLLNMPADMDWGIDTSYIAVGDVQRARTVRYGPVPLREWRLPYQVVGRPGGGTQAAIIWDSVATRGADDYTAAAGSQYMTWQEIADAGVASWAELAAPTT